MGIAMRRKYNLQTLICAVILLLAFWLGNGKLSWKMPDDSNATIVSNEYLELTFRSEKLRDEHFEKHGRDMGFDTAKEYEKAASEVVSNEKALHKIEAEDGDDVYYLESTNEFVIVSTDGYIRTYFCPNSGKAYFDRQ